jgi:hypothetical protein
MRLKAHIIGNRAKKILSQSERDKMKFCFVVNGFCLNKDEGEGRAREKEREVEDELELKLHTAKGEADEPTGASKEENYSKLIMELNCVKKRVKKRPEGLPGWV